MLKEIIQHLVSPYPQPPAAQPKATPEPLLPAGRETVPFPPSAPKPPQPATYTQGDEVTAVVSVKTCPHPKMLFIQVPDAEALAVTYVQEKKDWRTNDRMKVRFARVRPDGVLEFDGPRGPHRNKFGRRS